MKEGYMLFWVMLVLFGGAIFCICMWYLLGLLRELVDNLKEHNQTLEAIERVNAKK